MLVVVVVVVAELGAATRLSGAPRARRRKFPILPLESGNFLGAFTSCPARLRPVPAGSWGLSAEYPIWCWTEWTL